MMLRRLAITVILGALAAGAAAAGTLAPGLEAQLQTAQEHELIKCLVVLKGQPDVIGLDKSMVGQGIARKERHRVVVQSLQDAATSSQRDLVAALTADKAAGQIAGFVPHWIINGIVLTATPARIREIALRDDVEVIEPDLVPEPIEPVETKVVEGAPADKGFVTPGLAAINAPRVWHELGINGAGTIIAGLDSGVDVTHPALGPRWRGHVAPASQCWFNPTGSGSVTAPFDGYGHGTHTMGTMTGASPSDTVGVAPGARWIATNAIATGTGLDNQVIQAFEWLADPDGNPNTSADVPDVVQNSWGVAAGNGYLACDTRWYDVIDNCEAAGVVTIWSAGNEGPGPSSLRSPPNRASTFTSNFSVGSTRTTYPYLISGFSSRGPSQCGGPYAMKPEVTAPGQDILSTYPGNQYAYISGTSMAGPHVAGVVALMRQAKPDLDVDTIKQILMETSRDLGLPGEDNDYGHGIIDAYAAVLTCLNEIGTVTGTIIDSGDSQPLAGVLVRDILGVTTRTTGSDGLYAFSVRSGERAISAGKFGFVTSLVSVDIPAGATTVHDIVLQRAPWSRISGTVRDGGGAPVAGALVTVQNAPVDPVLSGGDGTYELELPAGEGFAYDLVATAQDLAYDLRHVGLEGDIVVDFTLPDVRLDSFESGGFGAFGYLNNSPVPWTIDGAAAHDGTFSARSGAIGASQQTVLSLDYYVNGSGEFSFWVATDSEPVYDAITVAIDGTVAGSWSGSTPWTRFSRQLATGLHTITWTYRKDSSASVGQDAAWIDLLTFPGTGVQPFPEIGLDQTELALVMDAGTTTALPVVVANSGGQILDYTVIVAAADGSGPVPTWLTVTPAAGAVHPYSDTQLAVGFDGAKAPAGVHAARLTIVSNDPDAPQIVLPVSLTVTGVSGVDGDLPRTVTFAGAVPNPFNPATSIRFSLPRETTVRLRVYDVAGRLVRSLVDGPLPAGAHSFRWNGRTDLDRNAASGVYFARLQADGLDEIRGMTLVR